MGFLLEAARGNRHCHRHITPKPKQADRARVSGSLFKQHSATVHVPLFTCGVTVARAFESLRKVQRSTCSQESPRTLGSTFTVYWKKQQQQHHHHHHYHSDKRLGQLFFYSLLIFKHSEMLLLIKSGYN